MRADRQLPEPQRKALIPVLERARAVEDDRYNDVQAQPFYLTREQWLVIAYAFEGVSTR
jgi:hypothetical protein